MESENFKKFLKRFRENRNEFFGKIKADSFELGNPLSDASIDKPLDVLEKMILKKLKARGRWGNLLNKIKWW